MSTQHCMILMNRQQSIITDEGQDIKILRYIRSNLGCTRADITRGLEGTVLKKDNRQACKKNDNRRKN
jgi:hypothetical protein